MGVRWAVRGVWCASTRNGLAKQPHTPMCRERFRKLLQDNVRVLFAEDETAIRGKRTREKVKKTEKKKVRFDIVPEQSEGHKNQPPASAAESSPAVFCSLLVVFFFSARGV